MVCVEPHTLLTRQRPHEHPFLLNGPIQRSSSSRQLHGHPVPGGTPWRVVGEKIQYCTLRLFPSKSLPVLRVTQHGGLAETPNQLWRSSGVMRIIPRGTSSEDRRGVLAEKDTSLPRALNQNESHTAGRNFGPQRGSCRG